MPTDQAHRFGAAVRARRAELAITLDQLAAASGVSRGTLSRIENDALNTSLANATAIARALGVALSDLLEQAGSEPVLVPAAELTTFTDDNGIRRASLARPAPGVELIAYSVPPGARSAEFPAHRSRTEEVLHVLAGRLEYVVGEHRYQLAAGDTLSARADAPHHFGNPGKRVCAFHMLTITPR
ncbi:helix-turn-helix domain-containing protein [Naumannella huperziae]